MFTWEESDRAKLTVGCTVEYDGERREVSMVYWDDVALDGESHQCVLLSPEPVTAFLGGVLVENVDPATLLPPSLATLNRMAVESFGEGAVVYVSDDCELTVQHDASDFVASFCSGKDHGATAARECARWLAARGR